MDQYAVTSVQIYGGEAEKRLNDMVASKFKIESLKVIGNDPTTAHLVIIAIHPKQSVYEKGGLKTL